MQVSAENLYYISRTLAKPDPGTCDSLSHKPISPKERCGTPVERIPKHMGLLDWPFGQNSKTSPEDAAEVEFAIRKYMLGLLSDAIIVLLRPAFLQANNLWDGTLYGKPSSNLSQPFLA
jgi:hypothetical protein